MLSYHWNIRLMKILVTTPPILLTSSHFEIDSDIVSSEVFFNTFPDLTRKKQSEFVEALKGSAEAQGNIAKSYFEKIGIVCKKQF